MEKPDLNALPNLLYADDLGRIYDHPRLKMVCFSGNEVTIPGAEDLIPMPEFSKLFFIPDCPPVGLDPSTGRYVTLPEMKLDGKEIRCHAVAAFLEPGLVRSYLPAAECGEKSYTLPTWAYTAVGFRENEYWAAGFRIEYNSKWDPRNYDDRDLIPAMEAYEHAHGTGSLVKHLGRCATENHCFAAKNLFFRRWEAPLPVSQGCNAACLGCLSLQPDSSCEASHNRIDFRPSQREIVSLAIHHLERAPEAIVSFGQGCEGEPLTESDLIEESIREIRRCTGRGTLNLNTNGSRPDRIRRIAQSGLDSIRISLNSAQSQLYHAYYRPKDYVFEDVVASIALSREMGLYTMLNYLVFPGVTDQEDEVAALSALIRETDVHFVHLKNLCIDPQAYVSEMPVRTSRALGIRQMVERLKASFPHVTFGYFNQPVR